MEVLEGTNQSLPGAALILRAALRNFLRVRRPLLVAEVALKLATLGLGAAASTLLLALVVRRTGSSAVTNNDIARFLLTPWAIVGVCLVAVVVVALAMSEQAVLLAVASRRFAPGQRFSRGVFFAAGAGVGRIVRLGSRLTLLFALAILPALVVCAIVYRVFLSGHDINFYLARRPPEFLLALGIAAVPVVATAVMLAVLYVRWLFAIPIVLLEGGSARHALAESRKRVHGSAWKIARLLGGWHLAMLAIGALSHVLFLFAARLVLDRVGTSHSAVFAAVLGLVLVQGGIVGLVAFLAATGHALITLELYFARRPGRGAADRGSDDSDQPVTAAAYSRGKFLIAAAAVLVVVTLVMAGRVAALLRVEEKTQISAHRGYSKVAPENTLSAITKAIESGAEWSEIDVQETADGVVVVLHDRDLMRLGGDPRRLADLRYDELENIEVGSRFSPEYAGERVPRLTDVIAAARGRMKLNIELKYYGPDPRLARDVGRILRAEKFEQDCFVASLDYASLSAVRAENPRVRTAAIVTVALGEIVRLDVDILSIRADLVTRGLLRSAHLRGKEVHVWTIDDPASANQLMERGVDNVITNDPAAIVRLRNARSALPGPERLLGAFRAYLGLEEKTATGPPPGEL